MLDIGVAYDGSSDELGKHRDEHAGAAVLFRVGAPPTLPADACVLLACIWCDAVELLINEMIIDARTEDACADGN